MKCKSRLAASWLVLCFLTRTRYRPNGHMCRPRKQFCFSPIVPLLLWNLPGKQKLAWSGIVILGLSESITHIYLAPIIIFLSPFLSSSLESPYKLRPVSLLLHFLNLPFSAPPPSSCTNVLCSLWYLTALPDITQLGPFLLPVSHYVKQKKSVRFRKKNTIYFFLHVKSRFKIMYVCADKFRELKERSWERRKGLSKRWNRGDNWMHVEDSGSREQTCAWSHLTYSRQCSNICWVTEQKNKFMTNSQEIR